MTIPPDPTDETIPSAGRSAAIVSAITVASRVMGLVRTLVVTSVLGITFLGNTYSSANALPNLLFEIVVGGAVAAALLPAIAGAASAGRRDEVEAISSAVLNRALLIMTPVVLIGILLREPLMRALTSAVEDPGIRALEVELGSLLLIMFLPQLWFYAVGVVLTAVLHAFHRFAAPALAPLLSSVVVTATYLLYGFVEGPSSDRLEAVSPTGKLILGIGTTLGVVVLSLSLVPPARRLKVRWRRVLEVPEGARRMLKALIGPAVVTVGIQQLFLAGVLVLANRVEGGVVAYQLAFTTLLVFWAVFPLPMATTLFPGLAAASTDAAKFAGRSAEAGTAVTVIVVGAAALMFALSDPLAGLVVDLGAGGSSADARQMVALTVAAFSPGLIAYGLYALYTRAAYATGDGRSPALAALIGFGLGLTLNLLAATVFDGPRLIAALAGGFSIGISAGAALLIALFRRRSGSVAVAGLVVSLARSLASGLAAGVAGLLVARAAGGGSLMNDLIRAVLTAVSVLAVYLSAQLMLGDRQISGIARGLRRGAVEPAAD
jgi:putative peptidoglycan lipid II flippase